MAEDEQPTDTDDGEPDADEEVDEDEVRKRIEDKRQRNPKRSRQPRTCRPRIEVLAIPNRRLILALYQNHAYHLDREKVEAIKQLLQELYAMTPEETERYFWERRLEAMNMSRRRRLKDMIKKEYRKLKRRNEIARALRFVQKILKQGMLHAFYNPIPPLVSVRLRNLSDIILEQICDLRNVDIPSRDGPTREGYFLIAIADWTAVATEHIYYSVQLKKNEELAKIEKERAEMEKSRKGSPKKTPDKTTETPTTDDEKAEGEEGEGENVFDETKEEEIVDQYYE